MRYFLCRYICIYHRSLDLTLFGLKFNILFYPPPCLWNIFNYNPIYMHNTHKCSGCCINIPHKSQRILIATTKTSTLNSGFVISYAGVNQYFVMDGRWDTHNKKKMLLIKLKSTNFEHIYIVGRINWNDLIEVYFWHY